MGRGFDLTWRDSVPGQLDHVARELCKSGYRTIHYRNRAEDVEKLVLGRKVRINGHELRQIRVSPFGLFDPLHNLLYAAGRLGMSGNYSRQDPAIFRLHSDVLCLIFRAALDEADIYTQRDALALPLTVTHVCRRWRTAALAYAHLWRKFFWAGGDSLEAALAFLERSREAHLTVSIRLEKWRRTSITDGLSAFRAASAQLARVTTFDLRVSEELIADQNISQLFGSNPFLFPVLLDLGIEVLRERPTDPPRLNIASPSLVRLYLNSTLPHSWETLISPSTTHVTIRTLVIRCADLQQILELTPNLHTLSIVLSHVVPDEAETDTATLLPSGAANGRTVDSLLLYSVTGQSLRLVQEVIPVTTQIREVIIDTSVANTPGNAVLDFLHIDALNNITSLRLVPGELSVSTADRFVRAVHGELTDELLDRLCDLAMEQPVLNTLREVTVCISQWDEFLWLVHESPVNNALPALERVVLLVGQDRLMFDDTHEPSVEYSGPQISAPRWTALKVVVDGLEPPTFDLVRSYIRARGSLTSGSSHAIAAEYVNRDDMLEGEEDYRATFGELVDLYDAEYARVVGLVASD